MQKVVSQAQARDEIEKQDAIKKRAARQAAKSMAAPQDIPVVECTVLPMGDGKISMGDHVAGLGTAHYEEDEKFDVQLPVAVALYERGFVNFPGAKEAVAKARADRAASERAQQAADFALKELIENS